MPLTGEAKRAYQRAYHQRRKALRLAHPETAGPETSRETSPETRETPETGQPERSECLPDGYVPTGFGVVEPVARVEESRHVEKTRHVQGRKREEGRGKKLWEYAEQVRRREISPRAAMVAAEAVAGGHRNYSQAARAAGVLEEDKYLDSRTLQAARVGVQALLEAAGAPQSYVARRMVELSVAKQTKFFAHDGRVIDERTIDDNEVQFKATDKLAVMHGMYPRDADGASGPGSIQITLEQAAPTDGQPAQAQRAVIRIGE